MSTKCCKQALYALLILLASPCATAFAAADPQINPELNFIAMPLCRVFNTGPVAANGSRDFLVAGTGSQFAAQGGTSNGCGIPTSATAVAISLTAQNGTGAGALVAYAQGSTKPAPGRITSFLPNSLSTGSAIVPLANNKITVGTISYSASVAGDVTGYFVPQIQALIGGDGSIQAATSRVVSTSHAGTGFYYITIDRPARQCSPAAITYNYGHYASVGLSSASTPNVLSVTTWNLNSAGGAVPADLPFFFSVHC